MVALRAMLIAGLIAYCLLLSSSAGETPSPPFYADRTNLLVVIGDDGKARHIKTNADWQQRREHTLANMQQVMGFLPRHWRNLPVELQILEEVRFKNFTRKKITYRADPEDSVTAYLFVPNQRREKSPAMLCLHPTIDIGKEEPSGLGGNPDLQYAKELAERGYVTLAPDYWNFGEYRKKRYNPYDHGYNSGTMKGIWNHIRAIDLLQSLPEVDALSIGAIGHSLGGHNALWLAAFDTRIKVVVTSCGFNTFSSYAASPYGGGSIKNYATHHYMPRIDTEFGNDPKRIPFDWPEVLAMLAPRPLFVNAPLNDENFVVSGVNECLRAVTVVYKWMEAGDQIVSIHPDVGHSFPVEIRQAAYDFIDKAMSRKLPEDQSKSFR